MDWTAEQLDNLRRIVSATKSTSTGTTILATPRRSICSRDPIPNPIPVARQDDYTSPRHEPLLLPPTTPTITAGLVATAISPPLSSSHGTLLSPPPLTPLPIRTPHHFSHTESLKTRTSRRKWQLIARSLGHARRAPSTCTAIARRTACQSASLTGRARRCSPHCLKSHSIPEKETKSGDADAREVKVRASSLSISANRAACRLSFAVSASVVKPR